MKVALDHGSPIPLYHQLAEALRYRIATGDLAAGEVLPSLRRAAALWGVNLHTVRQAYAELARSGVVVTRTPGGSRVLPATPEKRRPRTGAAAAGEARGFVRALAREARLRHGLSVDDLIAMLDRDREAAPRPAVTVVECSLTQCQDLAGQLELGWQVRARPWVLNGDARTPPRGLVVATYFHYNDLRRAWPERLPEIRFLPIAPEADLAARLRSRRGRGQVTVTLFERDDAMARNIAADLVRILPATAFRVRIQVVARAEDGLTATGGGGPILFSPRMWGELSEEARRDPRVQQVRYVLDPAAVSALASDQGWSPR